MKKINFLDKLKKEGKLKLVESSEEIKSSYLKKADNSLKSSKILLLNKLYENSVSEAYYCMYDSLLALLFKTGIKSENHSASIILLKELFNQNNLYRIISFAKEERIDKQYYTESQQKYKLNEESCKEMILNAESFLIKIRVFIDELKNEDIKKLRDLFQNIFKHK